jgi:3-hydroxyacyl-CoA dehydrogenase/enoyl-CoA hydratase/3-hydroxybutyryl-CoA epimerase
MTASVALTFSSDQQLATIQLGRDDEAAVALDMERMNSFVSALEQVKSSKAIGLVIKAPSLNCFCVGADISLIKGITDSALGTKLAAEGQRVFDMLEDLSCMTVAAISGPCVGGGCELVLACKVRLISNHPGSAIGLPETKLGILPGFGGSYRLPRLIGLPKALDIILGGKTLRSSQALKSGLVHEVVTTEQLLARAEEIARGVRVPRKPSTSLSEKILTRNPVGRLLVKRKSLAAVAKQAQGFYPALPTAVEITVDGLGLNRVDGMRAEASALGGLIVTPESKALVHVYFLTEASKSLGKSFGGDLQNLPTLVVGAGTMGAGIAGTLAKNGNPVIVKDTTEEALKRGKDHVTKELSKVRYLSSFEKAATSSRIDWITSSSPTEARTALVIEAVFENMALKKQILSSLASRVHHDCVLASNTSSLSVTKIAEGIDRPERVVGMHFFNPVEKMPLVEIIRGEKTSDHTVALVAALATKLGKFPIVVRDVPGFLVNRILVPYLNEALHLLQQGHSVEAIDEAATSFGMPMGPIRLLDEVGLDVAAHVSTVMTDGYGERMSPPPFASKLTEANRKGKKSGGGFYDYSGREWKPWSGLRNSLGLPSTPTDPLSRTEIGERLIYHLVNEAMKCLQQGVAGDDWELAKKQIDLGTVMGIGFPPFRGGVLHYAEKVGLKEIRARLGGFQASFGDRYAPFDE